MEKKFNDCTANRFYYYLSTSYYHVQNEVSANKLSLKESTLSEPRQAEGFPARQAVQASSLTQVSSLRPRVVGGGRDNGLLLVSSSADPDLLVTPPAVSGPWAGSQGHLPEGSLGPPRTSSPRSGADASRRTEMPTQGQGAWT